MVVWLRYHQPFAQMWSLCSLFLLFSLQSSLTFIEIQYCTTGVKALACHRTSECHSFYHSHGYKSHSYWYVPLILWQGTLEGHCVIVSFINICSCISTCCSLWITISISMACHEHTQIPSSYRGSQLSPHNTRGSLGPHESTSQTAPWSVHPFLQGLIICPTVRQLADICININSLYLVLVPIAVMLPNNTFKFSLSHFRFGSFYVCLSTEKHGRSSAVPSAW